MRRSIEANAIQLDEFDLRLLRAVQQNNQMTLGELSEHASLSVSACRRRLAALRKAKVIMQDTAVVDPVAVGRRMFISTLVRMERDTPDAHVAFRKHINDTPEIIQAFFITGFADYSLLFAVDSLEEYNALADRLFTQDVDVRSYETSVVMKRLKWGTAVPIYSSGQGGWIPNR